MELLRGNRLEVIIGKRGKTDFLDQDIHFTVDKRLAVFPEINLSGCQMQLDDLRISDTVRPKAVPEKALEKDANTLLLLGFDGADYMK